MTGHFPGRYNIDQHFAWIEHHVKANMPDWLDPNAPLLPRILRDAGYATGHFGKWHLTNIWIEDAPLPDRYGFDEYGAFNLPGKNMPVVETADRAIDFIRRHKDKPFFVNLWIHETHTPHYPEPALLKEFEGLSETEMVYASILAAGDRDVGKVMAVLDELGLRENTLVIFSSDNGPESPNATRFMDDESTGPGFGRYYSVGGTNGLKGQKRSLYAGGVRVPFIVRWPGVVAAGKVDKQSVITAVDLLPTLAQLAGAKLPDGYVADGEDVSAALRGEAFARSKPIYWVWPPSAKGGEANSPYWPHLGYQSDNWKLLVNSALRKTELYRVSDDWYEAKDVSAEHPEVTMKLLAELDALRAGFPDTPPASVLSSLRKQDTVDQPGQ
jgi:N-acetylgalactosamine-6-sulfatase